MGILSMDPQQQGLLAAAFAAMKASGPSRTPVSFGQVVGEAGTAGMAENDAAAKLQADLDAKAVALKKAKADLALQQSLQGGAGANGILGAGMSDPDVLEAVGTRLSLAGHAGGAGLIAQAQKIRAAKSAEAQMATMKSVAPVTPDPQEFEQSADQGTPQPVAQPGRPGIFGSLAASEIPQIAAQAKASQAALDAQKGAGITPQHWIDLQGKLATQETALTNRNVAPNTHLVKDATSSTGWSWKDLRTGKITSKDAPPPATSMMNNADIVPPNHADLHGDDYLATLPTGMSALIKSIAEGKVDPAKAASMRYGNREAIMQRVMQYDPNYNQQRPNVWKDFTSGKTAGNITAMNTVISHMGTVNDLTDALGNGNVQTVNALVNRVRTEFGKPEINNAGIAIQAMGNELMRVFRQVGASESETKAWESKFNAAKGSPEQLKGALKVAAELLQGRLDAVNDQWKRGMAIETDFPDILSPKSKASLDRIKGVPANQDGQKSTSKSGKPIVMRGGKWVYEE